MSNDVPGSRTVGPITQTDIVRFAGAGGDFNPLHHDPEVAVAAGFERPIAMGQFTAGLLGTWLTDWCGVENLRRFEVRFTAPLQIGDTVELSGLVAATDADLLTVDLRATSGTTVLVTGQAVVVRH
jgi:3-hydroxybutyryl-CoA dehydratase